MKSKRFLILAVVLMISVFVFCLPAAAVNPVNPSDTLDVYLRTNSGETLLHTYTLTDMEELANGEDICYSGIDAMPWTVKTIATGVYIEDLLDDIGQYTLLDVWDFYRLHFVATDGAKGIFTYDDLLGTDRYYYAAMHEAGGGLNEDNEIDYDLGEGKKVKAMLSIKAWQRRLPVCSENTPAYEPERYTILFGISEDEVDKVASRVSSYKRGVEKLIIDMGNVNAPTEVDVTGISLTPTAKTLTVGKSIQLNETVYPTNATDQSVTWSSGNSSVATVSSTGFVTAKAVGTAIINVTSVNNPAKSTQCTITVTADNVSVTSVSLSKSKLTLAVGATHTLVATVMPANATDDDVTWESEDEDIAKVSSKGVVTGLKTGTVEITAYAGDYSDTCTVTVSNESIAVKSVGLNTNKLNLAVNKTYQLSPVFNPDDATNTDVYWSSSAPGVVAVDTNGLLTAKNVGTATITVMADDGGFKAQCEVIVSASTASFSDISGNWAKENIEQLYNLGFITGYSDSTFKPNATISRGEFASILMRILANCKNITIQSGETFSDTVNSWAKDYISTAVAQGITSGYGNGKFGINDNITREQIAVMLAQASGYDKSAQALATFTDKSKISSWAAAAVAFTAKEGLFTGYADGSFKPQNNATRAEAATLLLRFYQLIK